MRHFRFVLPLALLLLGACAGVPERASVQAIVANPSTFDGATLWVTGTVDVDLVCTAAACLDGQSPCNDCAGRYVIRRPGASAFDDGGLLLRASEGWPGEIAQGVTANGLAVGLSDLETFFGCHGNDVAVDCAPSLPSVIRAVEGEVDLSDASSAAGYDGVIWVEATELGAPQESETRPGLGGAPVVMTTD